jgi:chromosome segregation ATPase
MSGAGRDTGINNQNMNSTLKGKLQALEEDINGVAVDMNNHKKELVFLKTGKDNLQDELKARNLQVKSELATELNKVEEQMKTHFSHQKAENTKLQGQITLLKNEKTNLQTLLNSKQFYCNN